MSKKKDWLEKFGDWENYLGEKSSIKHKKYVHKIGNMTILLGEYNLGATNSPFGRKKTYYKKSLFQLNKDLANYNDFKFSHVDKRGQELAKFAVKIWSL